METDAIARLQNTAVFGGLDRRAIELLLSLSRVVDVPAGALVIREGELGDKVYVLESGRVEILKNVGGELRLLNTQGPGDCFGEMALLDISPRSASVRTLAECRLLEIPADALYRLYEFDVQQFSLLTLNLGREVSRRLRETESRLGAAVTQPPPADAAGGTPGGEAGPG
jgi:CRP-like cAMP-binding protein